MSRVLISWLGLSDIKAMQGPAEALRSSPGPVLRLLRQPREEFDIVYLINDLPEGEAYRRWLPGQLESKPDVRLLSSDPLRNQYQQAYDVTRRRILEALAEQGADAEYTLLLSPGQPAAQLAMLVAHEAIFRRGARMVNVHERTGVEPVNLRLAVELLPEPVGRPAPGAEPGQAFAGILGCSAELTRAKREAQLFAPYAKTGHCIHVLLLGESGTGKELFARAIHQASGRRGPLVPVNCGAVVGSLAESELFGHVKSAFTGATADRKGAVEEADKGTLFLDEVGDMPAELQVKLLRFLNDGSFRKVGEAVEKRADVRVVAATHRDLPAMVRRGEFRGDLYERLNGKTIQLPPLRWRRDDVEPLALHALSRFAAAYVGERAFTPEALEALRLAPWPGNVRQLERAVWRLAAAYPQGGTITADDVAAEVTSGVAFPERAPRPLAELDGPGLLTRLAACLDEAMERWRDAQGLPLRPEKGGELLSRFIEPLVWGRATNLVGSLYQAGLLLQKSKGDSAKHQKHLDRYAELRARLDEAEVARLRRG